MCRTKRRVRSVSTLPKRLFYKYDFERRNRAMRYIKEEYDYIFLDCHPGSDLLTQNALTASTSVILPVYKLDQMIAEMKFNHTYDPYTVLTVPRIRAQIKITDKYDPQFRTKK